MANQLDVTLAKPRTASRSVYRGNASIKSSDDSEEYYRINVFNIVLDQVSADLNERFSFRQRQSIQLSNFLLQNAPRSSWDDVKNVAEKFSVYLEHSMDVVRSEFFIWQHFCSAIESSSILLSLPFLRWTCVRPRFIQMHTYC